jgi:hypothetical protein
MNKDFYVEQNNWSGSYYELAIELQSSQDNIRLEKALQALWSHPNLKGHWLSKDHYGQTPDVFNIADEFIVTDHNSLMYLYGVFFIPEIDQQAGCLSIVVREKDGSDWLDFCFATGMLKSAFSVKYPLETEEYPWSTVLDKYLLQMADMIYQQTPYDLALIGDEVSGLVNKAAIISEGIEHQIKIYGLNNNKIFLSPAFWDGLSIDKTYEVLPSGLRWATFAQ